MTKELLFSVTASDCDWQYFRSGGPGGQNVNKVSSGVRCIHRESGARGQATDTRYQDQNRKLAFRRMAESKEFKAWHKMEVARRLGKLKQVEENVDAAMRDRNLRIEVKKDGKWELENG